MDQSLLKTEILMKKYGYKENEINQVKEAIIFHSCRKDIPRTVEGKVLATADALAHLMTNFYLEMGFMGWTNKTYDGYHTFFVSHDFSAKKMGSQIHCLHEQSHVFSMNLR